MTTIQKFQEITGAGAAGRCGEVHPMLVGCRSCRSSGRPSTRCSITSSRTARRTNGTRSSNGSPPGRRLPARRRFAWTVPEGHDPVRAVTVTAPSRQSIFATYCDSLACFRNSCPAGVRR